MSPNVQGPTWSRWVVRTAPMCLASPEDVRFSSSIARSWYQRRTTWCMNEKLSGPCQLKRCRPKWSKCSMSVFHHLKTVDSAATQATSLPQSGDNWPRWVLRNSARSWFSPIRRDVQRNERTVGRRADKRPKYRTSWRPSNQRPIGRLDSIVKGA